MMLSRLLTCGIRGSPKRSSTQASAANDASIDAAEAGSSTSSLANARKPGALQTGASLRSLGRLQRHLNSLFECKGLISSRHAANHQSLAVSSQHGCLAESAGTPAAYTVNLRVSSNDSGHFTPFEAGFSLSSASDPAKDVILRLEAESNEETRVRLGCTVCDG